MEREKKSTRLYHYFINKMRVTTVTKKDNNFYYNILD